MTNKDILILNNTISIINDKLNIKLPISNNIEDYIKYTKNILNIVKNPKYVPLYLVDEKSDLEQRLTIAKQELEANERDYVNSDNLNADSVGSFVPGNPNSQELKYIRRNALKIEIIPKLEDSIAKLDLQIKSYELDFGIIIKDPVKELIKIMPNERYKDILLQSFIFKKKNLEISKKAYLTVESVKEYKKRGIKILADILLKYSVGKLNNTKIKEN